MGAARALKADAAAIGAEIGRLLDARDPGATVCPSEVARSLAGDDGAWRDLMPAVRDVAAALAAQGRLVATQGGAPVDAKAAKGPIRLGRPAPPASR